MENKNLLLLKIDLITQETNFTFSKDDVIFYFALSVNKYVNLSSFKFRISIFDQDNNLVHMGSFPDQPGTVVSTDLDIIKTLNMHFIPDREYKLLVDYSYNNLENHVEYSFIAPRPTQPFPSWIWTDKGWTAPIPQPLEGPFYTWNEKKQKWDKIKSDFFASNELSSSRYGICKSCDKFIKLTKQCKECFCIMPIKTKFNNESCPLGKW